MREYRSTALLAAGVLAACGGQARGPGGAALDAPMAGASLFDSSGTRVGVATFSDSAGSGWMAVSVTGLTPGPHGIHVHETGACTPPGFESAGSHFNPDGKKHGIRNPAGPHAGDMPNLDVEPDGSADTTLSVPRGLLATVDSGSIIGPQKRALVIHADPDDHETDPSGNSGARVVCGVVERR